MTYSLRELRGMPWDAILKYFKETGIVDRAIVNIIDTTLLFSRKESVFNADIRAVVLYARMEELGGADKLRIDPTFVLQTVLAKRYSMEAKATLDGEPVETGEPLKIERLAKRLYDMSSGLPFFPLYRKTDDSAKVSVETLRNFGMKKNGKRLTKAEVNTASDIIDSQLKFALKNSPDDWKSFKEVDISKKNIELKGYPIIKMRYSQGDFTLVFKDEYPENEQRITEAKMKIDGATVPRGEEQVLASIRVVYDCKIVELCKEQNKDMNRVRRAGKAVSGESMAKRFNKHDALKFKDCDYCLVYGKRNIMKIAVIGINTRLNKLYLPSFGWYRLETKEDRHKRDEKDKLVEMDLYRSSESTRQGNIQWEALADSKEEVVDLMLESYTNKTPKERVEND